MEIRQLSFLLALAEERHFGRAARRMNVTQPALSQQIQRLERQCGVMLFLRTTRNVEVTEAGAHLVARAREILGGVERASAEMALLASGETGHVSVGFIGTATYDVLPLVARTLRSALPQISLELRGELLSPDLLAGVRSGTYDLALLRPGVTSSDCQVEVLRSERLVAALSSDHPLAYAAEVELSALSDEHFIMHPSEGRSSLHQRVLEACARAGFQPSSTREVRETSTMVVLVAAGHGVALVPEPVRSLRLDGVAYLPLATPELVALGLARRSQPPTPAVARVAEVIRRCASAR